MYLCICVFLLFCIIDVLIVTIESIYLDQIDVDLYLFIIQS